MSLFFVDMQVGDLLTQDAEGVEFPDASTAKRRCAEGLMDMAKRLVTANATQTVTATLRDGAGAVLAVQTLSLTCSLRCTAPAS
jgi:hypothetical protein